jgi:cysteinyl-tRNA synthetase
VPDDAAAVAELRRLLATDLDVPAALDLATEAGGATARTLAGVLGLT